MQGVEERKDIDGGPAQGREDGQPPGRTHQAREAQHGEDPLPVRSLPLVCCGTWQSKDLPGHQAQDHGAEEEGDKEVAVDGDVEDGDSCLLPEPAPGGGRWLLGLETCPRPASPRQSSLTDLL